MYYHEFGAVTCEELDVPQVQDDRDAIGEFGQEQQVEVPSVEVVAVDGVGQRWKNVKKLSAAKESYSSLL